MSVETDRLAGLTGGTAVKDPVLCATTANITLSSTQTIDGITPSSGDRILAKNQTVVSENGIYNYDTGTWSRARDFDGARDVVEGTVVYVREGTENGNNFFRVDSTGGNTPGTDSITFAQTAGFTSISSLSAALDTDGNAINESEGSDVASASTTNIWSLIGNTLHVTGVANIDSFSTAPRIGAYRTVIFDSSLRLVHSTTALILPGSTNMTVLGGDVARIYAETTIIARVANFESVQGAALILQREGKPIASASTTNVWSFIGDTLHITGGVSIDSFSTAPNIGARRRVIFDSTLVLLAGTNLILPSSTDITTAAGDIADIYADSTIQMRLTFEPADGRPVIQTGLNETIETVSSGGAFILGSGVTIVSSDSTSGMAALQVRAPVAGAFKEILFAGSATALTVNTTATTITFLTSGSSLTGIGGTTTISLDGDLNRLEVGGHTLLLRGLSATIWQVVSGMESTRVSS